MTQGTVWGELQAELTRLGADDDDALHVEVRGDLAVFTDTQVVAAYDAEEALFQLRQADTGSGYDGAWQALARCDEQGRQGGVDGWAS